MAVNWSELAKIIEDHRSFLITSHIRPDCDALGSELGMAGVLEALGKDVVIVLCGANVSLETLREVLSSG